VHQPFQERAGERERERLLIAGGNRFDLRSAADSKKGIENTFILTTDMPAIITVMPTMLTQLSEYGPSGRAISAFLFPFFHPWIIIITSQKVNFTLVSGRYFAIRW
jgi:hypothetical protein